MHEKARETSKRTSINFPWGIAYILTYLKNAGHTAKFLDGQALQLPKEKLGNVLESLMEDFNPDVVGISAFSTQFNAVRQLSALLKKNKDVPVVVGGPLATYQAELTLRTTDADICVIGDGELTVIDLLNNLDALENVDGIAYAQEGKVVFNKPRTSLVNLDDLPIPDFTFFDMERYLRQANVYAGKKKGIRTITFISSRGCPFSCNFCSKSSKYFRTMSPGNIFDTLSFLKREFGIEEVSFGDELFLSSKSKFRELGPLLKKLDIPWGSQARVNIMDGEFLDMVKEAGCIGLGYGIESGSQKILDNMNKKTTVAQIESAMKETLKRNINVKVQIIFGYPGEDETTVQETIDLFKRIDHPGRRFNVITPIPGSSLYDDCIQKGLIKDEVQYLCDIEKSFGIGKVLVNFTQWPDDEIYPRKYAAEEAILSNYINNSWVRRARYFFRKRPHFSKQFFSQR